MFTGLKIEEWLKVLIFAGLLSLVVIIFSQKIEFTAVDLGRHLENGKIVWQDSRVLFTNFYSYTEPQTAFINHHWLSGVIYFLVYSLGGFKALTALNIILILAAFILAFRLAQKKAGFYLPALISIPVIFILSERVEVRPEIFSYFFIFLIWFIIDRVSASKNYRRAYWLVPLFVLWANMHIYFFIGLALIGIKAAAEFLPVFIETAGVFRGRLAAAWQASKVWFINLGVLFFACLLNPNFIRGLLYPFNIFNNYAYEIAENKTIFYLQHLMIDPNIAIFKALLLLLLFSSGTYFFFRKKIPYFELLSALFFSALALFAIRNLAIFGLAALVLLSANLVQPLAYLKANVSYLDAGRRQFVRYILAGLLLFIILIGTIYLLIDARRTNIFMRNPLGWGLSQGSDDSINFFRENNLQGPIFNNYDLGSALIFWLYGQEKVFVDNRPEAYSNDFFNNIYRPMQLDENTWLKESAAYKFKTVYFSHTDFTPWAQKFLSTTIDSDWALVYFDRYTVIYLSRKNNEAGLIAKLALSNSAVRERLRSLAANSGVADRLRLASFAVTINQPDLAEEIYQDILFNSPDNGQVLSSLASIYAASTDRATEFKALAYYERALRAGFVLPGIYNQIGLVDWRLGDYVSAESSWHQALKLDRKNESALYYLNQIEQLRLQGELK
ncbi:MAG: hypothetical protein WC467_00465 [Patescibacteria group bacterium]